MRKAAPAAVVLCLVIVLAAGGRSAAAAPPDGQPASAPAAAATPAKGATPASESAPREFAPLKRPTLLHTAQLGIALLPGTGYRVIFPYEDDILCEVPDGTMIRRVCTGRLPFFLDAQISFGVSRHWDVLLDLRFGIEKDFGLVRQFAVSPGFRYWVDPELHVKFFATIQGVIDTTTQQTVSNNADFGVRNANGVMYDVMRNVGIYLQFGETIGFRRWLRFEIDGGLGVQARFP